MQVNPIRCKLECATWNSIGHYTINGLHEAAVHSSSRLFTDECLVYRDVDAKRLQEDLDTLEKWEKIWQMQFHIEKYPVIWINQHKHSERQTNTSSTGIHSMESNSEWTSAMIDLSCHTHVDATTAKASKILGFLRRNLNECTNEVKQLSNWRMSKDTGARFVHSTTWLRLKDRMGTSDWNHHTIEKKSRPIDSMDWWR